MAWPSLLLLGLAVTVAVWGLAVLALIAAGRRSDAQALARFIPDCVVLFRRLLADPRIPRSRKVILVGVLAYLALPFDLVPDFIPVAGQLDDAVIVGLALRFVLRAAGAGLIAEHWPGPTASLNAIQRLSGLAPAEPFPEIDALIDRAQRVRAWLNTAALGDGLRRLPAGSLCLAGAWSALSASR